MALFADSTDGVAFVYLDGVGTCRREKIGIEGGRVLAE